MPKDYMIERMLLEGCITLDKAEALIKADYDTVESEWVHSAEMYGAFTPVSEGI